MLSPDIFYVMPNFNLRYPVNICTMELDSGMNNQEKLTLRFVLSLA